MAQAKTVEEVMQGAWAYRRESGDENMIKVFSGGDGSQMREEIGEDLRDGYQVTYLTDGDEPRGTVVWTDYREIWDGAPGRYVWDKSGNRYKVQVYKVTRRPGQEDEREKVRTTWRKW